jgi:hypothetical protein
MDMQYVGEEQDKWPVTEIAVSILLAICTVMKLFYSIDETHRLKIILIYCDRDESWNSRPRKYLYC